MMSRLRRSPRSSNQSPQDTHGALKPPCVRTTPAGQGFFGYRLAVRCKSCVRLHALANQKAPRPVEHQRALLLGALNRHEAHRRPCDCLADRSGIGSIVLAALHVGLHLARWHQSHIVAKLSQLASPVLRRGARLHADEARQQLAEKLKHLAASKLFRYFLRIGLSKASTPCTWKTVLARSVPIVRI